jgi:hypothetical protein
VKEHNTISGDTGSNTCFDLVKGWLKECEEKYILCKLEGNDQVALPARVLDVLFQDDISDIRLLESHKIVDRYVCLSRRWIDGHTITTKTSNIEQ